MDAVSSQNRNAGMTLMECVFAMALVALALPAVLLVLIQCGSDTRELRMHAEARRAVMVRARQCLRIAELPQAARLLWAHAESGECLGQLEERAYAQGVPKFQDQAVSWLVVVEPGAPGPRGMRGITLTLEYPAAAPATARKRIEFHAQTESFLP